jgi:TRAP-type C4-dicarboxylate transport system permease small subunit
MQIWLKKSANLIGGGLFLTLFLVFLLQIAARFGFNQPLPWTDEAAVILYLWVILWSAAVVVPQREHVAFDLLWNAASWRVRQGMQIAGNLLIGGLALVAIPASWDYIQFIVREKTPVLDIPFMLVFMPFMVLLISLVLRSVFAIYAALRGQGLELTSSTS